MPNFSQRSKDELIGVNDNMVRLMNASIIDSPVDFTVTEGLRTAKTQGIYYTWGRSVLNPNTGPLKNRPLGAIVTKRDGIKLKSNHQAKKDGKGTAVDVAIFKRDKKGKGYLDFDDDAAYLKLSKHIKAKAKELNIPIVWGGDWKSLYDAPHFELK